MLLPRSFVESSQTSPSLKKLPAVEWVLGLLLREQTPLVAAAALCAQARLLGDCVEPLGENWPRETGSSPHARFPRPHSHAHVPQSSPVLPERVPGCKRWLPSSSGITYGANLDRHTHDRRRSVVVRT